MANVIVKKNRSPRLTREVAGWIKWLWLNTPLNQAQISDLLGAINQGRVSEVINEKRFKNAPPLEYGAWS